MMQTFCFHVRDSLLEQPCCGTNAFSSRKMPLSACFLFYTENLKGSIGFCEVCTVFGEEFSVKNSARWKFLIL